MCTHMYFLRIIIASLHSIECLKREFQFLAFKLWFLCFQCVSVVQTLGKFWDIVKMGRLSNKPPPGKEHTFSWRHYVPRCQSRNKKWWVNMNFELNWIKMNWIELNIFHDFFSFCFIGQFEDNGQALSLQFKTTH